jgi:amino acid permease
MLSTRCIQANRLIVLIVTVAVGIEDRPSAAPQDVVWVPDYEIVKSDVSFTDAITAVSSLVFAFAGTPAFFSIASEMREPRHYNRSLIICQSVVTGYYLVIGIVIYYFCGSYVSSPALGSAGPTIKIVSYGFALPGLIVSTLLFVHVSPVQTLRVGLSGLIMPRSRRSIFLSASSVTRGIW